MTTHNRIHNRRTHSRRKLPAPGMCACVFFDRTIIRNCCGYSLTDQSSAVDYVLNIHARVVRASNAHRSGDVVKRLLIQRFADVFARLLCFRGSARRVRRVWFKYIRVCDMEPYIRDDLRFIKYDSLWSTNHVDRKRVMFEPRTRPPPVEQHYDTNLCV